MTPISKIVKNVDGTLAERFSQVQFREIGSKNTRLNINNVDMANQKEKRERAINYWKDRVI